LACCWIKKRENLDAFLRSYGVTAGAPSTVCKSARRQRSNRGVGFRKMIMRCGTSLRSGGMRGGVFVAENTLRR
jgi:hypothetical protein